MRLEKLREPFAANDIEWRIQSSGISRSGDRPWGMCLAYVTARAIMDRLDDVCGPGGWKNNFRPAPEGGILCDISIKIDGEWVTKCDGASNTEKEAVKGGLSSAMKRAGSQWGIGRYLYNFDVTWAIFEDSGKYKAEIPKKSGKFHKWNPPALPGWALPVGDEPDQVRQNEQKQQQQQPEKQYATQQQIQMITDLDGKIHPGALGSEMVHRLEDFGKNFGLGNPNDWSIDESAMIINKMSAYIDGKEQ